MERPILFSAPMVRAILAGQKTQTRRLVMRGTSSCGSAPWSWLRFAEAFPTTSGETLKVPGDHPDNPGDGAVHSVRPRIHADDRLWVRETFGYLTGNGKRTVYRADDEDPVPGARMVWKPSIFMRRRESRITLLVGPVRVERLHALTEEDALAEGMAEAEWLDPHDGPTAREAFEAGWDRINGKRAPWATNPWVWVVTFRRVEVPS